MKKKIVVSFLAIVALWGANAFASDSGIASKTTGDRQEQPNILAMVNVYNSKIISQEGGLMKISFDLENEERIQPQIKYAIQLLKAMPDGGQILVDEKNYAENIDLGSGELIHRDVTYQAPQYLTGKYQVWVRVANSGGMPFGVSRAGEVNLQGDGKFLEILTDSCYLTVDDGKSLAIRHSFSQGVKMSVEEALLVHCKVKNSHDTPLTALPIFETYLRTTMGELIMTQNSEAIFLSAGEEKFLDFTLDKAKQPQVYAVNLFFQDVERKNISNQLVFSYSLRGLSATIENIRLEKDFYVVGETANAIFDWLPAPDSAVKFEGVSAELTLTDQAGVRCGEPIRKVLERGRNKENIAIIVTNDCINPQISATIQDIGGNNLDKNQFQITSKSKDSLAKKAELENRKNSPAGQNNLKNILVLIFIALFLGVVSYGLYKKSRQGGFMVLFLIIWGTVVWAFFSVDNASAITWTAGDPNTYQITFTATPDKAIYAPGEVATVSGDYVYAGGPWVDAPCASLELNFPVSEPIVGLYCDGVHRYGSNTFLAGAVGSYNANLVAVPQSSVSIPYTVAVPAIPTATVAFNKSNYIVGETADLSWTVSNAPSATLVCTNQNTNNVIVNTPVVGVTGSHTTAILADVGTLDCTITPDNAGQAGSASAVIALLAVPSATATLDQASYFVGQSAVVKWEITNSLLTILVCDLDAEPLISTQVDLEGTYITESLSSNGTLTCLVTYIDNPSGVVKSTTPASASVSTLACGTAARTFLPSETDWGSYTFCPPFVAVTPQGGPDFPDHSSSLDILAKWRCVVFGAYPLSVDCEATIACAADPSHLTYVCVEDDPGYCTDDFEGHCDTQSTWHCRDTCNDPVNLDLCMSCPPLDCASCVTGDWKEVNPW